MATKCKFTLNDVMNKLWDGMEKNRKGEMDNERGKTQTKFANSILKGKADQIRHKKLTNKPESIPFYED